MSEGTPCTSCGSRRTTEIRPTTDGPVSIWCHACGAIATERIADMPERALERDVRADANLTAQS